MLGIAHYYHTCGGTAPCPASLALSSLPLLTPRPREKENMSLHWALRVPLHVPEPTVPTWEALPDSRSLIASIESLQEHSCFSLGNRKPIHHIYACHRPSTTYDPYPLQIPGLVQ